MRSNDSSATSEGKLGQGSVGEDWGRSSLFPAANDLARRAQQQHKALLAVALGFMVLGVAVGLLPEGSSWHPPLALGILAVALTATVLSALLKLDRVWFTARAIAESAKTRMWRYAMRAHPYGIADAEARNRLLDDLTGLLRENAAIVRRMQIVSGASPTISSNLSSLRRLPPEARLSIYVKQRLSVQSEWYAEKARTNQRKATRWVVLVILANTAAVVLATARLAFSNWPFFPVEVAIVIASSALAWMQASKFRELATSYALAAHELFLINGTLPNPCSDEDLALLVSTAEGAISREHALWTVREDQFERKD